MTTRFFATMALVFLLAATAMAGEITFVFESYPPYEMVEGGTVKGVDADMIKAVCSKLGVTPKFEETPWKRAMNDVKEGRADAIFSLYINDERKEILYFPDKALSQEKNILVSKKGSGVVISKLADLDGKTIGVCSGYAYGDAFDNYKGATRDESANTETLIKKLENDRVPVIVINSLVYKRLAKDLGLTDKLEIQPFVVADEPMYVAFSKAKGDAAKGLADAFSKAIGELASSGEQQKILDSYQ